MFWFMFECVCFIGFLKFRRIKNRVELFGLLTKDAVIGIRFFLINLSYFVELSLCVVGLCLFLAVLTGSPDLSILATDVETGTQVARVEDAHG